MIVHDPIIDIKKAEELYSEKNKCVVKYVCTTELNGCNFPIDVFYCEEQTEYDNRYFGLYYKNDKLYVCSADSIENEEIATIEVGDNEYYSRYRHDFVSKDGFFIDGGRSYLRTNHFGKINSYTIENGNFIPTPIDS